jgi:glutamate synthase domain-containing protein 2
MTWWVILGVLLVVIGATVVHDLVQRKHAILRNFPLIGHLRFLLEAVGPELRQYIVTDNDEERPFSRDQRRWVYATSKVENSYFGFGTDNDLDRSANYIIVKQSGFPLPDDEARQHPDPLRTLPCAKILGEARGRERAFRPDSIVNVSAMSFGSLSGPAVEALNRGCALSGSMQTTGEGGISDHHRNGGDLVWQIGTGYFGCRNPDGTFNMERLVETVANAPVRAIEIKLSQGAKPGLGGVLPASKVTPEIAAIRGVPVGVTCKSPSRHSAFDNVEQLLEFVESIAGATGLPVGIKSAVGGNDFWSGLAEAIQRTGTGPDFVTIDGGEGGTGAAPLAYSDHVSLPFHQGFTRVYREFVERDLANSTVFIGSGKLGMPERALTAMALGCDLVNVGRTAMFSIGCIQAQRCHTDRCPTGVATQNPRLTRGLVPDLKSVRCANYLAGLRFELERLARTCGVSHPALVKTNQIEILQDQWKSSTLKETFGYESSWGLPTLDQMEALSAVMGTRTH